MNAPSVAARGPMTDLDLETMWQGCPLFPQLFVIYLCHCFTGHFFYFKKLLSKLLISSGCSIILALKALCKVRGGPSWCLTAPAESDPVLPLGCTGLAALLISAELQDLYSRLKSTHTYQKTAYHMYIWHDTVYLISSESSRRQLTSWDFKFNWSF